MDPVTAFALPPVVVDYDAICKTLFEGLLTDKARAEYHAK